MGLWLTDHIHGNFQADSQYLKVVPWVLRDVKMIRGHSILTSANSQHLTLWEVYHNNPTKLP